MNKDIQQNVLVLNCGSSSIKFAVYGEKQTTPLCYGLIDNVQSPQTHLSITLNQTTQQLDLPDHNYAQAMQALLDFLKQHSNIIPSLSTTGHRVVHGGKTLIQPTLINKQTLAQIESCNHLAPLHNPANLLGIRTLQKLLPQLPHVAIFDTAFHQTLPAVAFNYAMPHKLCEQHDIRKYGFHGISYDYVSQETANRLQRPRNQCNMIIAHLGNGASVCAIKNGQSVDVSMGMTPLAGIMMGTRCGNIDPGIIPYLVTATQQPLEEIMTLLAKNSGLLGLSGISHDMRDLIQAMENNHPQATLALEVFAYQISQTIAGYMVPLQTLDALVFTGGIGEHTPWLRQKIAQHLQFLTIKLNETHNHNHGENQNGLISTPTSPKVFVIKTNEEVQIAALALATVHAQEIKP